MGFWKTERGICGHSWVDMMDNCMETLQRLKIKVGDKEHEITMEEFADLIEFISRGHIIAEIRHPQDGSRPLSKLFDDGVKTYKNRGQEIERDE